jgi:putative DNA primase/helicase
MKLAPSREHDHVTPPGEEAFHQTDAGNAAAFAALHASDLRYDHQQQRWLTWLDGLRWERDRTGGVQRLVKEFVRNQYRDAASVEDPKERTAQVNFALKCEARDRLRATEELARNEAPLSDAGDTWDGDPWLLGVDNGVVDLRTGQHRAGRPEDRLTMASPLAFDPTATCPRFERFMQEVLRRSRVGGIRPTGAWVQRLRPHH